MVETITLSIPAVDVLGDQLNLNVRQYPFEIPRLGQSPEERGRIAEQAWNELESTGLASGGQPEPEVEDALYLLCSSEVSIAAAGLLDVRAGQRLVARVVATGEVGVVGVIDGRGLNMSFLSPEELPQACANLLPEAQPGVGKEVRAIADRSGGQVPPDAEIEGLREVEAFTTGPKFRIGHFVVSNTERGRRRGRLPGVTWFDNDRGRYALMGERSPEGWDVVTCGPADRAGIADRISDLLERARLD